MKKTATKHRTSVTPALRAAVNASGRKKKRKRPAAKTIIPSTAPRVHGGNSFYLREPDANVTGDAQEKRQALAMHVESVMTKAAQHDAALDIFNKHHKATTDMGEQDRHNLLTVVSYLVGRSNTMQTTIEQVEKRERSRAEAVVKQHSRPKRVDEMSRDELEEELAYLRTGARRNY